MNSLATMIRQLLPFSLCSLCFSVGAISPERCSTPMEEVGSCVKIRDCPPLLAILRHPPVSQENATFLRKSQCGYEGGQPKVCCVLDKDQPNSTPTESVVSDLLPTTATCGIFVENKLIGGETAQLGEFPWTALVEYQKPNGRGFHCGGVLISNRYVLTAAHCVKQVSEHWRVVSVRLGEHDTNTEEDCEDFIDFKECTDPPVDIPVVEQIVHEDYQPNDINQHDDIALLRLAKEVTFTDFVKPVCVLTTSEILTDKYNRMSLVGWDKTETQSHSNKKQKLEISLKPSSECSSGVNLTSGQFCAGGSKHQDSCKADSGGSLVKFSPEPKEFNWYVVGVDSFGTSPCGQGSWPRVYTKVPEYVPWIISKLKP